MGIGISTTSFGLFYASSKTEPIYHNTWHKDSTQHGFLKFLLESSCFTTLCQFLLHNKVNQFFVYMDAAPLFRLPSHAGHHRARSRAPCAVQQDLVTYLFRTH